MPSPRRAPLLAALLAALVTAPLAACSSGTATTAGGTTSSTTSAPASPSGSASATASPSGPVSASSGPAGIADQEADDIVRSARAAFGTAKSVHVKGSVVQAGQQVGLDMRIAGTRGATGTITLDGNEVKLVRIGKVAYLGGDRAFWTKAGGAAAAKQLAGKYVRVPSTIPAFRQLLEFTQLPGGYAQIFTVSGALQQAGGTTERGVRAVKVSDAAERGTLSVASTGKPYPLRIAGSEGRSKVDVEFFDYDEAVALEAPPARSVVTLPGA